MSFIINNGDQDPAILINGFGEGYGDTGDHFAVTDDGEVIYTTVQEGYKEGDRVAPLSCGAGSCRPGGIYPGSGPPMWRRARTTDMVSALHGISPISTTMRTT